MTTPVPYWYVQQMVISELEFLNSNVNEGGAAYFSGDHLNDRLQNLSKILKSVTNADAYLFKCDQKSLDLIINNLKGATYIIETKDELKKRLYEYLTDVALIVNTYDKQLNTVMNYSYSCQIETLNKIEFTHIKLACVLIYTAILRFKNNEWYLPYNKHLNFFIKPFNDYLLNFLKMLKNKDGSINKNVRVIFNIPPPLKNSAPPYVPVKKRLNSSLITMQNINNVQYQNESTDIEICYVNNNKLYYGDANDQQLELTGEFLEINTLPYCLYTSMLPNNFAISALNLYKLANKKLKLGNVLFVNKMRDRSKETIIRTMRVYYHACQQLKTNKIVRVVGSYKGYSNDYNLAALDFTILVLVASATECQLKYLITDENEKSFMELKRQVCKSTLQKLYSMLINNDFEKDVMTNLKITAVDKMFT